jgi:TolC family type I secretion outer membrane protein
MHRFGFSVLVCLTAVVIGAGAAIAQKHGAYPSELSLAQAVEIALRENPALSAAQSQVEIAEQRVVQERAGLLPRLTVSEGYQRSNNPTQVFSTKLNQERFAAQDFDIDRLNQPNAVNDFATNVTATWPLYDGGRSYHGWQQAQLGRDAAGQALARACQQVTARTTAAYAGALLASERLAVVDSAMASARAHLAAAETRYGSGLAVRSDLLQAQVRLADLEQQRLLAESQIEVARSALNAAMGAPDPVRFDLSDRLEAGEAPGGALENWLATARERRLELKELDSREAMAQEEIGKARSGHLPRLDLVGNYQIHTEDFDGSADNYSAGAVISLDLFSGLAPSAKMAEARAARRQVQALRRQVESQVFLEVRQAYTQTASASQRITVSRQAVAQAEEALRIVANRYAGGLLTIVDLLTAENALQHARMGHAQALHDYAVGKAGLRLAAGVLDEK